jgi:hypothetical protein
VDRCSKLGFEKFRGMVRRYLGLGIGNVGTRKDSGEAREMVAVIGCGRGPGGLCSMLTIRKRYPLRGVRVF